MDDMPLPHLSSIFNASLTIIQRAQIKYTVDYQLSEPPFFKHYHLRNDLTIGSSHKGTTILIGQAIVSAIANPVYKSSNSVKLNSLLTPLAPSTRHISKASLILILIGVVGLQLITAQARLDGLKLNRLSC